MAMYGSTANDFAAVKTKNAKHGLHNPNARFRKLYTIEDVTNSPMVADPLRLLDICATSDGGAALVLTSMAYARKHTAAPIRLSAAATVTPVFPSADIEMPEFATDSWVSSPRPDPSFRSSIAQAAYQQAGLGPTDIDLAEVYDLSTALELDWYEHIGLCQAGDAESLLRAGDTSIGGRIPVNPSGGLACFGEAVPAQAIAQACELTWQIRGQAQQRQVDDARVGIAVNQGLFGHASSIIIQK